MPPFNDYLCLTVLPASPDSCMPLAGGGIPTACTHGATPRNHLSSTPEYTNVKMSAIWLEKWMDTSDQAVWCFPVSIHNAILMQPRPGAPQSQPRAPSPGSLLSMGPVPCHHHPASVRAPTRASSSDIAGKACKLSLNVGRVKLCVSWTIPGSK